MLVVGNSLVTLVLYMVGRPEATAWTGYVAQATPSAVNDLLLGIILAIAAFAVLNHDQ